MLGAWGRRALAAAGGGGAVACAGREDHGAPHDVLLVQVLHRHGARTPFRVLPGMAAPGSAEWEAHFGRCRAPGGPAAALLSGSGAGGPPSILSDTAGGPAGGGYVRCPTGHLTQRGEEELRALGAFLRRTYVEAPAPLVASAFPEREELEVTSTATSRTVLSAQSLLRGLFPDADPAELDALVEVPRRFPEEIMIANFPRCPRLRKMAVEDCARRDAGLLVTSTTARLREVAGPEVEGMSLVQAGDPLRALTGHGAPWPRGYSAALARDIDACGHGAVEAGVGADAREVARLSSGLLLADMQRQILDAAAGRSGLRMAIRSGHDVSVAQVLVALGLPSHAWPAFGSSVVLELRRERSSSRLFVRVLFYDGVPPAVGPAVDVTVPLEKWTEVVAPLLLTEEEYLEQCRLPPGAPEPPKMLW